MTFVFKGDGFERLVAFCRQVVKIQQTPDLISFVAGERDYVGFCRIITDPDDSFQKRFAAMCQASRMNPDDIRRRMRLVASVLGIYKRVDYYSILGVSPNADEHAIKQAYRKKAQILHPDKAAEDAENGKAFIKLHEAYLHLSDPKVRLFYDQSCDGSGYWVEGEKSLQMPAWSIGFGRLLSWMFVFIGIVIVVLYGLDIYEDGSITFLLEQLRTDQLHEPESISKEQFEKKARAKTIKIVAIKIPHPNSDAAFEEDLHQKQNMLVPRAGESTSKKTIARVLKKTAKIPAAKKKVVKRIKAQKANNVNQQQRLIDFLKKYTSAYEQKDLHRFRRFFVQDALEGGKPFKDLLPIYQQTFNKVEALRYHIDLKAFTIDNKAKKIKIEGAYTVGYRLPEKDWGNSSGTIRMELLDSSGELMVSRLDYEKGIR